MSNRSVADARVPLTYMGREYEIDRGFWSNGSGALLLINKETGAGLPASLQGPTPQHPNEALVVENDGILKTLEDAGVGRATPEVTKWLNLTLRRCEIIHPQLIRDRIPDLSEAIPLSQDKLAKDRDRDNGRDR
jgi:hypothetical protein